MSELNHRYRLPVAVDTNWGQAVVTAFISPQAGEFEWTVSPVELEFIMNDVEIYLQVMNTVKSILGKVITRTDFD